MNQPPFIVTEEMGTAVEKTRLALAAIDGVGTWPVLNYQYGYIKELNETLQQFSKTRDYGIMKFPCVYLAQPFSIKRYESGWYGELNDMRLFIMMETGKNYKAHDRMNLVFKPIIYRIYDQLLIELKKSKAFYIPQISLLRHKIIDRYYWGNAQQSVLGDVIDCREVSEFVMKINNNSNCEPGALTLQQ